MTILFADLQGSTSAAEDLDPEDWASIMNGAFQQMVPPINRYQGTLARLLGDAVLAFFGAPVAHEDDPLRAVHAGLEIVEAIHAYKPDVQETWGIPIDVRVGINTGLVVVGEIGSDLRLEYTALGDAVNIAARMEQTADPGTVRVTAETWGLVEGQFEGVDLGEIDVKGKSRPVEAVRVVGTRSVEGADLGGAIVGRTHELGVLDGLRRQLVDGSGWVASVMGEAGMGKTRLLEEFRREAVQAEDVATTHGAAGALGWMHAFNHSFDSSVPYSIFRDLLVRWWGLKDDESGFEQVDWIVTDLGLDRDQDPAVFLSHVAGVSLPDDEAAFLSQLSPPAIHARVREVVTSYLEAEAGRRPLILVLEDVHWADSMSLALVEEAMPIADHAPFGLLFSMRPYREEPIWQTHQVAQRDFPHRYTHIPLAPLEAGDAADLLRSLLEDTTLPEETKDRILRRSDGNALFIEQMVRAIREGVGDADLTVPSGLAPLLTARLDRLDAASKEVAQIASVIAAEFDRESLYAVAGEGADPDARVATLLRRGILVERKSEEGKVLAFHHALMQEAAYSTLLLRSRRDLHRRVAEYLVSSERDAVQEIARHYLEAGETDTAFPFLVEAGERNSRSMALADAIRFFKTASENVPSNAEPALIVRLHDGLGQAYSLVPDLPQSASIYQQLIEYADEAEQPSVKVTALNRLAINAATLGGDLPGANRYLKDARALAKTAGDELGLAQSHLNACFISSLGGDAKSALVHDEEAAKLGEEQGVGNIRMDAMARMAVNAVFLMDFEQASDVIEKALDVAKETDSDLGLATVEAQAVSRLRLREGDRQGALESLLDHHKTLIRYASVFGPASQIEIGNYMYEFGEIEEGLSRIADGLRQAMQAGHLFTASIAAALLTHVYAELGMEEQVSEYRRQSLEAMKEPTGDMMAATTWADLGYANLALGRFEEADADFQTGVAASATTTLWERPRLLIGRVLAGAAMGETARSRDQMDEVRAFLEENGLKNFDTQLWYARGIVHRAEGRPAEALEALTETVERAAGEGLRRLQVEALVAASAVAGSIGDDSAAGRYTREARSAVAEITDSIIDEELREAVVRSWLRPLEAGV